jgi:hypothetical protein
MTSRLQSIPCRIALFIALALIIASGVTSRPARAQSDEQAVIAVATHFFDGMRARDTALMQSTSLAASPVVIPGGAKGIQLQETIGQFIANVGKGTGPGGDEVMQDPKVQIDGQMASLWAYYTYTKGGQTAIDHCGIDTFLFRKGPDGWKIFNLAGTIRKTNCTPVKK